MYVSSETNAEMLKSALTESVRARLAAFGTSVREVCTRRPCEQQMAPVNKAGIIVFVRKLTKSTGLIEKMMLRTNVPGSTTLRLSTKLQR